MMNSTGGMSDGVGWGMGFGGFFMILFWGLIIFGIVIIIKWMAGKSGSNELPKPKTALDLLQERYARGEINEQEYQQKRHDIEQ